MDRKHQSTTSFNYILQNLCLKTNLMIYKHEMRRSMKENWFLLFWRKLKAKYVFLYIHWLFTFLCAKMNNHYDNNKLSSTTLLNQTTPDQQSTSQFPQNEQMRSSLRRQSLICNSLLLPTNISASNDTSVDCQNHYNEKRTTNSYASKRYIVYKIAAKKEKSCLF